MSLKLQKPLGDQRNFFMNLYFLNFCQNFKKLTFLKKAKKGLMDFTFVGIYSKKIYNSKKKQIKLNIR